MMNKPQHTPPLRIRLASVLLLYLTLPNALELNDASQSTPSLIRKAGLKELKSVVEIDCGPPSIAPTR